MAKKRLGTDSENGTLMIDPDDTSVEAVLARIANTKRLAIDSRTNADVAGNPKDIYLFDVKLLNSEVISAHVLVHGKCFKKTVKAYGSNYVFVQSGSYSEKDKAFSRTVCQQCGEQLNAALADTLIAETKQKHEKRKKSYQAYIREQILLGNVEALETIGK